MRNILLLLRRSTNPYLLPWLVGVFMGFGLVTNAQASPELKLEQSVTGNLTTVLAGQSFIYKLEYRCASTTEHCKDVKLTSTLPAGIVGYLEEGGIAPTDTAHPHIDSVSVVGNVVTWKFINPLPAGSTGVLTLTVKLKNGQTPDGTEVTNEAKIEGSNAVTVVSNTMTVMVTAESVVTLTKELLGGTHKLDVDTTYRITLCNEGGEDGNGGLDLQNVTIVDPLLSDARFISATKGVVADADNKVTWPIGNMVVGKCLYRDVKVQYPSAHFSEGELTNTVEVTGTPVGEDEETYSNGTTDTFGAGIGAGTPNLTVYKQGTSKVIPEGILDYGFQIKNTGNVDLTNVVITDTVPKQLVVKSLRTGNNNQAAGSIEVSIDYQTNINSTWTSLSGSPFATPPGQSVVPSLDAGAGEYITELRWIFPKVPVGFRSEETKKINLNGFSAAVLSTDRKGEQVQVGDVIANTAAVEYTYNDNVNNKKTTKNTEVVYATAQPRIVKTIVGVSSITPGNNVTYKLELLNWSNSPALLEEPSIVDVLNGNFEYVDWTVLKKPSDAPTPIFEKVENYKGTAKTALFWKWSDASVYSLAPGKKLQVQLVAKVKSTTAPGSVTNTAYVIAKNPSTAITLNRCLTKVADADDIDGDGDTGELVCASAEAIITAGTLASMESIKWVKGQLDPDWHMYPKWGKTARAGTLRYRLIVKNTGNISMTDVVVVDILPFVTDTGVIDLSQRESAWQPLLIGAVNAGKGIKVFYSTEENPCRTEVLPTNPPGCKDPKWTLILPQDRATVRSLRFDFGNKVVEPGDELKLEWPMYAPVNAPLGTATEPSIAWNSFGYVATQKGTEDQLLPSEPIKVGIEVNDFEPATYGNYVWLDENKDGLQGKSEIGLNGVRVDLYQPGADGKPNTKDDVFINFTRTADGPDGKLGFYIFSFLDPGQYFAKFVPPVGYKVSPQDAGNDDNLDSDVDPITHTTMVTDLLDKINDDRWDMGLVEQGASLGNYVWFDSDQNGLQNESADNGINGVQVTLYRDNGDDIADPESDEQVGEPIFTKDDIDGQPGYYRFDDIKSGQYFVKFSKLPRNADGFTTPGETGISDPIDSDPDSEGVTELTSLEKGEYDRSWDAGVIKLPSDLALGNRVWLDHNGDAVYNDGEKGINDVKVNLYWDADGNGEYTPDGDTPDEYMASMRTLTKNGVPGFYRFEELIEGDYIVQIDPSNFSAGGPLADLISSKGAPDPDPAKDHDDNGKPMEDHGVVTSAVTLTMPKEPVENDEAYRNMTVDFGFHEEMVLALGNRVWRDVDQDAYYDAPTEKGINDVTVNLYQDTDGNGEYTPGTDKLVTSTQTANDEQDVAGYYLFEKLTAGNYIVQIDASNFSDDGPLADLISSKGAPDPDPAKDHDDNGKPIEDNGVVALAVTLSNPDDPNDEAAKLNLTVDFGFHEDKLIIKQCLDPKFYALHDDKLNDTQFFTIDPKTREVEALGPKYDGHDIEGMDEHPKTGVLYATSGDDPGCTDPNADPKTCDRYPHGQLYTVDKSDGSIEAIGKPTGFGEISAISFNPKTSVLWAWADREGLLTINIITGKGTWVFEDTESRYAVEALTWDNEGKILYAAANTELLAWDSETGKVSSICDQLPGQVEALDMAAGNVLLFAVNERSDLNINGWKVDGLTSCPPAFEIEVETPAYYDIEAITWPDDCDVEKEVSPESLITR